MENGHIKITLSPSELSHRDAFPPSLYTSDPFVSVPAVGGCMEQL